MNKTKKNNKVTFLIFTFALIFILPLVGSLLQWKGLPPGYGEFPSQQAVEDPGFSMVYFIAGVLLASTIACFFMFPKLFGFKNVIIEEKIKSTTALPVWFWWSVPVLALSWFFTWSRTSIFFNLENYTFVPLWWSFIFILDGIVYKRNNGKSLISEKPNTLKLLAVVSCFSWFAFEYLNFFVMENWYYPNNKVFSEFGNVFWFSLSYTTVLPAIFEWYMLLKTFKYFKYRYSDGPKLHVSAKVLIVYYLVGLFLAFGMGYYPYLLFWVLWVALVPLLSAAMALTGYWTPFTPIKDGNWSPTMLIALATLFNGFFWEMWNFGSEWFHKGAPVNPNYWKYSVPYLDKIHIFSEMPILGYWGYLFFGINCWVIWLIAGYIFDFDTSFDVTND
jgi:hypothetical protein